MLGAGFRTCSWLKLRGTECPGPGKLGGGGSSDMRDFSSGDRVSRSGLAGAEWLVQRLEGAAWGQPGGWKGGVLARSGVAVGL